MDTVQTLNNMLADIKSRGGSHEELLQKYVQSRLNKSIQNYYADLLKVQASLQAQEARKVFREMLKGEPNA